jgi:pyridoxine 5-phosphate synthase
MNPRLGVNIDHVATIRNARGGDYPDPVKAAQLAARAGADGITAHLREDRRHITDADIQRLGEQINLPLNLEMAATDEMLEIALKSKPHAACIVPEKREERTTEGGLDAAGQHKHLTRYVRALADNGTRVSLFIEPALHQLEAALSLGAPVVELHTGAYADACNAGDTQKAQSILDDLKTAARFGEKNGLEIHAGHGLTFDSVMPVAAIAQVKELNIGHFLVSEAIFCGLFEAITKMRALIVRARNETR